MHMLDRQFWLNNPDKVIIGTGDIEQLLDIQTAD